MSHGQTRRRYAKPHEPGRLSYAQLREVAARRAAEKSSLSVTAPAVSGPIVAADAAAPPEIPMPMDYEVSRGVSRRDFVRAGAVAAIAGATSRAAFAGQATPRDAFDACMKAMTAAAAPMSFAPDVEPALVKHGLPKFPSNMPTWEALKDKVLAASRAIGVISASLARLNSDTIEYRHVKDAVEVVKNNCGVRGKADERYVFCPDLPSDPS